MGSMATDNVLDDIEEVVLDSEQISERVRSLGEQISREYEGKPLHLISILKGSTFFLADLLRAITVPVTVDFISISSYGQATEATGVVKIVKDLDEPIAGRDVLIVEDIVDTGLTLGYLLRNLGARSPASLRTCVCIDKPTYRIVDTPIDYCGFRLEGKFVVGYGLDFADRYRHLPCIATLKPEILEGALRAS